MNEAMLERILRDDSSAGLQPRFLGRVKSLQLLKTPTTRRLKISSPLGDFPRKIVDTGVRRPLLEISIQTFKLNSESSGRMDHKTRGSSTETLISRGTSPRIDMTWGNEIIASRGITKSNCDGVQRRSGTPCPVTGTSSRNGWLFRTPSMCSVPRMRPKGTLRVNRLK